MIQLSEHFASQERSRHSEQLRQKRWFIKARQDQIRRDEIEDRGEDSVLVSSVAAIAVTEAQIAEFDAKLDVYDEATIKALNENRIRLDQISERLIDIDLHIQQLLGRAYVMEDGRRVFLTEDRTQAFDEQGVEVTLGELDFDLVPKTVPAWESVSGAFTEQDRLKLEFDQLQTERSDILEFQEKLDAARDRIDESDITKQELDDLDAELAEAMPASVRVHVSGFDTTTNATDLKSEFGSPSSPIVPAKLETLVDTAVISPISLVRFEF